MSRGIYYFVVVSLVTVFKEINRFNLGAKAQYNNQNIKLVTKKVLDGSSETPIYKEFEVKLALSFFNDFDDDF